MKLSMDQTMATGCSSLHILIPRKASRTATRVVMQQNSMKQYNRVSTLRQSSVINKVFVDQEIGIACYIDVKGEMVCEGYDEGPRITRQAPQEADPQRIPQISDLQQLRREDVDFQLVNGIAAEWLN